MRLAQFHEPCLRVMSPSQWSATWHSIELWGQCGYNPLASLHHRAVALSAAGRLCYWRRQSRTDEAPVAMDRRSIDRVIPSLKSRSCHYSDGVTKWPGTKVWDENQSGECANTLFFLHNPLIIAIAQILRPDAQSPSHTQQSSHSRSAAAYPPPAATNP